MTMDPSGPRDHPALLPAETKQVHQLMFFFFLSFAHGWKFSLRPGGEAGPRRSRARIRSASSRSWMIPAKGIHSTFVMATLAGMRHQNFAQLALKGTGRWLYHGSLAPKITVTRFLCDIDPLLRLCFFCSCLFLFAGSSAGLILNFGDQLFKLFFIRAFALDQDGRQRGGGDGGVRIFPGHPQAV